MLVSLGRLTYIPSSPNVPTMHKLGMKVLGLFPEKDSGGLEGHVSTPLGKQMSTNEQWTITVRRI